MAKRRAKKGKKRSRNYKKVPHKYRKESVKNHKIETPWKGSSTYDPDKHDELVYKVLAGGGTIAKFCKRARISRSTYYRWYEKSDTFREASDRGKIAGEAMFFDQISKKMFQPQKNVAPKLIEMYGYNVYGIQAPNHARQIEDEEAQREFTLNIRVAD